MAKAGVEAAIWDLEAKLAEQPLWRYIGGTKAEITCGVSIGLQESTAALLEKVSREIACGYQRIKIKIKPGKDVQLVEAVRQQFPDDHALGRRQLCILARVRHSRSSRDSTSSAS